MNNEENMIIDLVEETTNTVNYGLVGGVVLAGVLATGGVIFYTKLIKEAIPKFKRNRQLKKAVKQVSEAVEDITDEIQED